MYFNSNYYHYPYPYLVTGPMPNYDMNSPAWNYPNGQGNQMNLPMQNQHMTDHGPNPFVVNIHEATKENNTFRTVIWTGNNLQVTLMNLNVGEDIGLEMHPGVDQFLRIEQGQGIVRMGKMRDQLEYQRNIDDDSAIVIPAGTWHNVINTGNIPLKLYSIYAPPNHPFGTIHRTKADAMKAEEGHGHQSFTPLLPSYYTGYSPHYFW